MTHRRVAVLITVLLVVAPSPARADWIVRPFVGAALNPGHGFVDLERTGSDSKLAIGAAAGWYPNALGFEFEVSSLPRFFKGADELVVTGGVTTIMANITWQLPAPSRSSRLRVYVAGGGGVVRARLDDALGAFTSTTSLAGGNAGGGIRIRVRPRLDINADVRYFKTQYGDSGRGAFSEEFVTFTRATVGAVFAF